eukprot:CAMPEP_0169270988 /NCGR_PEP_ID=MMETSP1016-20121227/49465_1 /TAXON_ID=342587 /ORGANISM="Karlodinium micrum, Strain CCMP2283" /LENGTH=173 /DNA_ID=CAMNT_0009356479 /DNA_START=143 /DNA_END=660 /DNA_ORIENTATION=-
MNGDEVDGVDLEGNPEAALLSAFRLADSFLSMSVCTPADLLALGRVSLNSVRHCEQPEILRAALEVLATLFADNGGDHEGDEASQIASTSAVATKQMLEEIRCFATSTSSLAERLTFLLVEGFNGGNHESAAVGVSLALLDYAPRDAIVEHHQDIAAAYRIAFQSSEDGVVEG